MSEAMPRKRFGDDDDYNEAPRRKKGRRPGRPNNTGLIVGLVLGGVFLAVVAVAAVIVARKGGGGAGGPDGGPGGLSLGKAPPPASWAGLNFEKTVTLAPGAVEEYTLDARPAELPVFVEVDCTGPVHVYVAHAYSAKAVREALESGKLPLQASGLRDVARGKFKVVIAAREPFVVFLSGAKQQTTVKLTVTGQ